MEARAILRYARISPRKVSIVMDLIRNKPLDEALAILQYTPKTSGQRKSMTLVVMEAINLILKENRLPLTTWRD